MNDPLLNLVSFLVLNDHLGTFLTSETCLKDPLLNLITYFVIGPRCPWGPIYGSGPMSVSRRLFADLTDVTLADEDSNLIPTDDVNMAILGNMAMQVAPCGGQD